MKLKAIYTLLWAIFMLLLSMFILLLNPNAFWSVIAILLIAGAIVLAIFSWITNFISEDK